MKKILLVIFLLIPIMLLSQSSPIIYFCESYKIGKEIGISDKFTTGNFYIIVKTSKYLENTEFTIHVDKFSERFRKFSYYKTLDVTFNSNQKYFYLWNKDITLDDCGIYRVFLLLRNSKVVVASSLVEIGPNY